MDYDDLSSAGKIQFWCGLFFLIIGLAVTFSGPLIQFIGILKPAVDALTSPTCTSGITIFGLGLAYISIAYSNENPK